VERLLQRLQARAATANSSHSAHVDDSALTMCARSFVTTPACRHMCTRASADGVDALRREGGSGCTLTLLRRIGQMRERTVGASA